MSDDMTSQVSCTVTPYLAIKGAAAAIDFYKRAFGAVELNRITDGDGRIGHAEIAIGGAAIYISDEYPEIGVRSAQTIGDSPVMIVLDVPDCDALFNRALAAGATLVRPLQDGFGGALRTGKLNDPYGHRWMITTRRR